MKNMLICALLTAVCIPASASDRGRSKDFNPDCSLLASVFMSAATARDAGMDTPLAVAYMSKLDAEKGGITIDKQKHIINFVYFDPVLSKVKPLQLSQKMYSLCKHGYRNLYSLE